MKAALRCLSTRRDRGLHPRCALDRGHPGPHVAGDGRQWHAEGSREMPDGVRGPWWVSFEEMLSAELRDRIGLSEDRGATLCITRACWALLEALGEVSYPLGHGYRPSNPVTGPAPDACYELLADVATPGGRRFCLQPRDAHTRKPPICADCHKRFASYEELATHARAMAVMLERVEDVYVETVTGYQGHSGDAEVRDHALRLAQARCTDACFDYAEVLKHQHVEAQAPRVSHIGFHPDHGPVMVTDAQMEALGEPIRVISGTNDRIDETIPPIGETFEPVEGTITFSPVCKACGEPANWFTHVEPYGEQVLVPTGRGTMLSGTAHPFEAVS